MKFVNAHYVEYTPDRWLSFDDVTMMPRFSRVKSRKDAVLSTKTKFTESVNLQVPIISSPMDCVTEADMVEAMIAAGGGGILHRFYEGKYGEAGKERWQNDIKRLIKSCGIPSFAISASHKDIELVQFVLENCEKAIVCVDVAHGHLGIAIDQIRRLRTTFGSNLEIISGSVTTPEAVTHMVQAGCNAVRVGVGSGSVCTTRVQTGHGLPLFTSIMLARRALGGNKSNVALIADGGIRNSGDIVKALAAGADSVMLGKLLAPASESSAIKKELVDFHWWDDFDAKAYEIQYRGQASKQFMSDNNKQASSEGVSTKIKVKEIVPVKSIINELVGGIRSGMSYSGVLNLEDLNKEAVFVEVTHGGYVEGTPHGLQV